MNQYIIEIISVSIAFILILCVMKAYENYKEAKSIKAMIIKSRVKGHYVSGK